MSNRLGHDFDNPYLAPKQNQKNKQKKKEQNYEVGKQILMEDDVNVELKKLSGTLHISNLKPKLYDG